MNGSGINLGITPIGGTFYAMYCLVNLWIYKKDLRHLWLIPIASAGIVVMAASMYVNLRIGYSSAEDRKNILLIIYISTFCVYLIFSFLRKLNLAVFFNYNEIRFSNKSRIIVILLICLFLFFVSLFCLYAGIGSSNSLKTCGTSCRSKGGFLGNLHFADGFIFFFGACGAYMILVSTFLFHSLFYVWKYRND